MIYILIIAVSYGREKYKWKKGKQGEILGKRLKLVSPGFEKKA